MTARYYRDSTVSKTDSVLVCMSSALEISLLHPLASAWESSQLVAELCEEEMTDNVVSDAIAPYRHREISSNVSQWLPNTLFIMTAAAAESDSRFNVPGHRRFAEVRNDSGFRQILRVMLRPLDPVVEPFPFGITERASIPSVPSVWPRRYSYVGWLGGVVWCGVDDDAISRCCAVPVPGVGVVVVVVVVDWLVGCA